LVITNGKKFSVEFAIDPKIVFVPWFESNGNFKIEANSDMAVCEE